MRENRYLNAGLMTVPEAVAFLRVSRSFLYAEMGRGALPWVKLGRARRIPRVAVIDYAASRLYGGLAVDPRRVLRQRSERRGSPR